jgi:hypothetical protein
METIQNHLTVFRALSPPQHNLQMKQVSLSSRVSRESLLYFKTTQFVSLSPEFAMFGSLHCMTSRIRIRAVGTGICLLQNTALYKYDLNSRTNQRSRQRCSVASTFCCCAAKTCAMLLAAQPACSGALACGSVMRTMVCQRLLSIPLSRRRKARTLCSMLNLPLPCVAPRRRLEYPNILFNARIDLPKVLSLKMTS